MSEVLVLQTTLEPLDDLVRSSRGQRRPERHVEEDAVVAHYGLQRFPVTLRERSPKMQHGFARVRHSAILTARMPDEFRPWCGVIRDRLEQ
jgi:hypothetical protein